MRTTTVIVLALLATVASWIFTLPRRFPRSASTVVQSQGPTVERLQRLSHLVTTRVCVADVLVGEGKGCRGAWLIRGDALDQGNRQNTATSTGDSRHDETPGQVPSVWYPHALPGATRSGDEGLALNRLIHAKKTSVAKPRDKRLHSPFARVRVLRLGFRRFLFVKESVCGVNLPNIFPSNLVNRIPSSWRVP